MIIIWGTIELSSHQFILTSYGNSKLFECVHYIHDLQRKCERGYSSYSLNKYLLLLFWQILYGPKKQTYMYSICVYEFFARHWMLYQYFKAHNIKILVHRENICACKLVYHLRLFHCLLLFQYCISFKLHKRVYTQKNRYKM